MNIRQLFPICLLLCTLSISSIFGQHAPLYMDADEPGLTPELFALGKVNTDAIELNAVFNASMTEFFFTRIIDGNFIIHHSELINGSWTPPEPLEMFPKSEAKTWAVDMTITQDGKTIYFLGVYSEDPDIPATPDIFKSEKVNGKWQLATKVGAPISTDAYVEAYPVVVADGSLYFVSNRPGGLGKQDIYRAQYLGDGKFDDPVSIPSPVNTELGSGDTYVTPDEKILISNKRHPENPGIYVSFKKNGQWTALTYLGEPVNSEWTDFCPYLSPDGRFFFFSRRYSDPPDSGWSGVVKGEVYWVDAEIIHQLDPN